MKNKVFNFSQILFTYFFIALILILITFFITGIKNYNDILEQTEEKLLTNTIKITNNLNSIFSSMEKMDEFLGNNIIDHSNDYNYINELFKNYSSTKNYIDNILSWVMYNWFDANDFNVITAKTGINNSKTIKMSFRYYVQQAHKQPWRFIIDGPFIGIPSQQEVIVGGMGITNKEGKFLGTINMGIPTATLNKFLDNLLSLPAFTYTLINNKGVIISSNGLHTSEKIDKLSESYIYTLKHTNKFSNPMVIGNAIYIYIFKVGSYPLYLVTGYTSSSKKLLIHDLIFTKLYTLTILLFLISLFFFIIRITFIKPIERLANNSQLLFDSRNKLFPKDVFSYELAILYKALLKLKILFLRNKRSQIKLANMNSNLKQQKISLEKVNDHLNKTTKKLESAIKIIKTSDDAKQLFLRQITEDLKIPVVNIINRLKEIEELSVKLPIFKDIKKLLDEIYLNCTEINNYTRFTFTESYINIKSLVEESLLILQKNAYNNNIKIIIDFPELLPLIKADRYRLKQVITALTYRAIQQTPQNKKVEIKCYIDKKNNYINLEIIDSGFGLEVDEIERIRSKLGLIHGWDGIELAMNMIELIIQNHKGKFQINSFHGIGTTYCISLPY